MLELIDRQAALDDLCNDCKSGRQIPCPIAGKCNEYNVIKRQPTIEPKRGKWIFEKGDNVTCCDGWRCSACNETYHTKVPYFAEYKFCPNCGAKMGGADNG